LPVVQKLVRAWPFLSLAAFTLVVGVVWHLSGVGHGSSFLGVAFYWFAIGLGAPFVAAQKAAAVLVSAGKLRPLVGLVLGLTPYLIADLWLRRRRASRP
jgi:hypothetical protein